MGEMDETGAGGSDLTPRGDQPAVIDSAATCTSVDAGAGTGKTTTMLVRIERAIEAGAVDPGDVLVLTFATEAAASIREAVAERLDPEAAYAIDVHTYHSFCHRLVREYAYYLGLSPEFDVVTEGTRRRVIERLLAETDYGFARADYRGDGSTGELAASVDRFVRQLSREDVDPETLRERLPDVDDLERLDELVLWLEREAAAELSFDNEAVRFFSEPEHLRAGREALVDFGKLLTYCRETIDDAPAAFREEPVVADVDRYLGLLQETVTNAIETLSLDDPETKQLPRVLFGNEIGRSATDRVEQTPVGRLKRYVRFLRRARHYADVYADYRAYLERERTVDFDELVRTATRLLEDDAVADEITDRWEGVYCDEFQDTDGTQFALLTELTTGEGTPDLLAIGDKDQAIYGWRGTDREGLDRLADVYDDHEAIELGLNFRSRQEILDLTNRCDYGPQTSKTLREVDRTPGEYDGPDPPRRVAKVESDELGRSTAEGVATAVSRLLNGEFEGVPERSPGDVAVIVRTNRHARAIADELENLRIPHEVSGSAGGDLSPGIRTVLSYLRVLADPGDAADAHLRRVLLYRYRLPEGDLDRLQSRTRVRADDGPGGLYEALRAADPDEFRATDRLERARAHLRDLERLRDVYPLAGFVRRFRELTRIEWFLTADERTDLDRIGRFVEGYDPEAVLETLTPRVVDGLERALGGGESGRERGARSDDRIDVMTVHQAKGLQFDTVLVPFLSDEEWCVEADYAERARYRLLTATLDDEVDSPLCADLAAEPVAEEWRVLHVALTRAENHLFVFGSSYDYEGTEGDLGVSTARACVPDAIEWDVAGKRMDLWESLTASFERVREDYPESVADVTSELAGSAGATPGTITYGAGSDDPLETREAIATVHRLGRLLREGTLLPAADAVDHADVSAAVPTGRRAGALAAETTRFPVEALSNAGAPDRSAAVSHSYTAMETHERCPRKHYLDHVVAAIDDPPGSTPAGDGSADAGGSRGERARIVGTAFHDVAEAAFYREYRTREAWHEAAERYLTARNLEACREAVLACVDRYFEAGAPSIDAPVHEWEPVAAELPVALDASGVDGEVVGAVDSIRRTPDGDLAVLDYKATAGRIRAAEAVQLRLYLRACEERFDEPIGRVGYVYVGALADEGGDGGPRVDLVDRDALPPWASVRETLAALDDPSFAATTPGEHCRYCPHRSLGCGPDEDAADERARSGTGTGASE